MIKDKDGMSVIIQWDAVTINGESPKHKADKKPISSLYNSLPTKNVKRTPIVPSRDTIMLAVNMWCLKIYPPANIMDNIGGRK